MIKSYLGLFLTAYLAATIVPLVGDPITPAAGVLRTRFLPFLLLVAFSKTGRYAVLLGTVEGLWP